MDLNITQDLFLLNNYLKYFRKCMFVYMLYFSLYEYLCDLSQHFSTSSLGSGACPWKLFTGPQAMQ